VFIRGRQGQALRALRGLDGMSANTEKGLAAKEKNNARRDAVS
jgi:hypothetical protein